MNELADQIETRFGVCPADAATVVTLPDGLPGFERCRRYVVASVPSVDPFTCLQGLDEPKPSFLTIDPRLLDGSYEATLSPADRARLDCAEGDSLLWLALVRFTDNGASVNLRAPVVINPARMTGLQVVAAESPYSAEYPLPLD